MSIVRYAAVLEAQPEGGFTVTFPDIPEAITEGDTREEALFHAADVLTLCLDERIESGDALPAAKSVKGGVWVELAAAIQAAMAVRTEGKKGDKPASDSLRRIRATARCEPSDSSARRV